MPFVTSYNTPGTLALDGMNATLSGIDNDTNKMTQCMPVFNGESSNITLSDNNAHPLITTTANGTYHMVVQPSSAGDQTWILVDYDSAPTASGMSWSSAYGAYEISTTSASVVYVQRLNLIGTFSHDVRCWRVN